MKIKIMNCSWNKSLEGKTLDVTKITSREPSTKQLLIELIKRIDNLVVKNNLKE